MTVYLRQSTTGQEIALGFFVDSTDGNTEETGLTIAAADIRLHKAGATTLATPAAGATHISNGIYYWVADATDTDTVGTMAVYCHPTGALATKVECVVLAANIYDSMIAGTDLFDVTVPGGATSLEVTAAERNVRQIVESQRGHHTGCGSIFYVQKGGSDANPGTYLLPFLTIQAALNACTANAHDTVIVLGVAGSSPSTFTEALTMSKAYVFLRGMGRDTKITTAGAASSTVTISAFGCEVSGFNIDNTGTGATKGVETLSGGDFVWLHHLFIAGADTGIKVTAGTNGAIENNRINDCAGYGVRVMQGGAVGTHTRILTNHIDGSATGVSFDGTDSAESVCKYNNISGCTTGVTVAAGASKVQITDNRFAGNTANYTDAGTDTLVQWNFLGTSATGAVNTVTTLTNLPAITANWLTAAGTASDFTTEIQTGLATASALATVATYIDTEVAAIKAVTDALPDAGALTTIQSDLDDIQARIPAALVGGRLDVDLGAIGTSTSALTAFKRAVQGNVIGTVGSASTTTSVVTSVVTPASSTADSLKGRILTFSDDTTTTALRGQSTDISASSASATPTLTVTALTTAPVSGDVFSIT